LRVKRGGDATMTSPSFDTVRNQTNDFRDMDLPAETRCRRIIEGSIVFERRDF